MKTVADNFWTDSLDNLANLIYVDERKALGVAKGLLEIAVKECGEESNQVMLLKYRLGIISMLLKSYDIAESYMLSAMELAEKLKENIMYADIAKYLAVLYESLGRRA